MSRRVCEFCLKGRTGSSFKPAPPGWEHANPIGPWCKFCDDEFRRLADDPGSLLKIVSGVTRESLLEAFDDRVHEHAWKAYVRNRRIRGIFLSEDDLNAYRDRVLSEAARYPDLAEVMAEILASLTIDPDPKPRCWWLTELAA